MMKIFRSGGLLEKVGVESVVEFFVEAVKGGVRAIGPTLTREAIEATVKRMMQEKRGELLAFIRGHLRSVDRVSSDALMRRHAERLNYGVSDGRYNAQSANELMDAMTQLYIALSTGVELDVRLEAFTRLGRLAHTDRDAFDAEIESLRHDVFAKAIRRAWDELDRAATWTAGRVDEASDWLEGTPEAWHMPLWTIFVIPGVIVALIILAAYL